MKGKEKVTYIGFLCSSSKMDETEQRDGKALDTRGKDDAAGDNDGDDVRGEGRASHPQDQDLRQCFHRNRWE
jgi:hypothetical protein